jgi:adenylate cyclase
MVNPFKDGMLSQACPMADVLGSLQEQLGELRMLKENAEMVMAPA